MRYSPLIRRLVQASGEARIAGYDIANRLADRCIQETDIVRRMLYNAVCDPRFKLHADSSHRWTKLARQHLEAFADDLSHTASLTIGVAEDKLDEFLGRWFQLMMDSTEEHRNTMVFEKEKEPEPKTSRKDLQNLLNEFIPGSGDVNTESEKNLYSDDFEFEDDENASDSSADGMAEESDGADNAHREEAEKKDKEVDTNEEAKNKDVDAEEYSDESEQEDQLTEKNRQGGDGFGRGGSEGVRNRVEDRFLHRIPSSLLQLAKKIGRSSDDELETSGTFQTASKSDITGITVGNDLNSVLPKELALLANRATEDIFLNNYVSRRLQVFSSASHGQKAGNHKDDGPIIICLDTSGSMTGEPVLVAKALTMAISIIAQRRRRRVVLVKYSCTYDGMVIKRWSRQSKEVVTFLSSFEMGGNNEDGMFRWLFNRLLPDIDNDFNSADVLCISDFGWGRIEDDVMEIIEEKKKQGMVFYGLNIAVGGFFDYWTANSSFDASFILQYRKVIDSMWGYKDGECFEYEALDENRLMPKTKN